MYYKRSILLWRNADWYLEYNLGNDDFADDDRFKLKLMNCWQGVASIRSYWWNYRKTNSDTSSSSESGE